MKDKIVVSSGSWSLVRADALVDTLQHLNDCLSRNLLEMYACRPLVMSDTISDRVLSYLTPLGELISDCRSTSKHDLGVMLRLRSCSEFGIQGLKGRRCLVNKPRESLRLDLRLLAAGFPGGIPVEKFPASRMFDSNTIDEDRI